MVSIISNSSASFASSNLAGANSSVEKSIQRLSSGSRITRAADDVAGLSVGTILATNVITLRGALSNASQAKSLLGIADGSLDNISRILQRNSAIATQSNSGALDDIARGFLDQEFQSNNEQINSIANTTNFNNIKLINGSIYNASTITSDVTTPATSISSKVTFLTAVAANQTIQLFSSAATAPDGLSRDISAGTFVATPFTSVASALQSSYPGNLVQFDGTVSASSAATNFISMVSNLKTYSGNDEATLRAKAIVSNFEFVQSQTSPTQIEITSKGSGENWNVVDILTPATAGTLSIDGVSNSAGGAVLFTANGSSSDNGALSSGGFSSSAEGAAGATAYSNDFNSPGHVPSVYAQGIVGAPILSTLTQTQAWSTGVKLSNVSNNPAFIGKMPDITGSYVGDNTMNLQIKVGHVVYSANNVNTNPTVTQNVVFHSPNSKNGSFSLQMQGGKGVSVNSMVPESPANFLSSMNKALETINVYQRRQLTSYQGAGFVSSSGIVSGDLTNSTFHMINNDFSNPQIQSVTVKAPTSATADAVITITIDGEDYISGYQYDGSKLNLSALQTPNTITNNDSNLSNSDGRYGFVSSKDPNKMLVWQYGSSTPLSITTTEQASELEKALTNAFGIGNGLGNAGLSFQVGAKSEDTIGVQIESAKTIDLFKGAELSIKTKEEAASAGEVLTVAIQKVVSIRAQVGALANRFEFAAANIESSIGNLDSARSLLLDTEVATESTSLAQGQVRLQAAISVLAQANQLSNVFLKLLS